MTDSESAGNKGAIHLWWALGIALGALVLRLSLVNFPTRAHMDEPIIATLTERFVDQGKLTANWAGFETQWWWSRPTYQFSPYTLVQSVIAKLAYWLTASPSSIDGYILLARVSSCCWGSAAVLLVFFLGRTCFSPAASLLGEATLATCFLQVQDSIYARVDSFLGCLVLLSLILAFQAAKRPGGLSWLVATSLCMGVTVAAKYNAFPVLVLIPFILFRWAQTGAISRGRAVLLTTASFLVVGAGFVGATPELLWRPGPLTAGIQYEFSHYLTGDISQQAHGWEDNNLFYWTSYLAWLGFGLLPLCFALLFVVRIVVLRRWEDFMLGTFLTVAAVLFLATKVRFERNLEICIGPLALVAGVTAWDLLCSMKKRRNPVVTRFLGVAFVILWFFQPLRVLYHFRETVDYPRKWQAQLSSLLSPVPTILIHLPGQSPESAVNSYGQVILVDYGAPASAEALVRWKRFFRRDPTFVLTSPWYKYNYPFSTVNVYHGPVRTLVFQKGTNSTPIVPVKPPGAHVDEK
jgi:4-amino-4-deoxy-L-arabinose transferase-like glycosyltransferase